MGSLLITQTKVIEISFNEQNFGTAKIKDCDILVAQLNHIKPIIGNDFYYDLLANIDNLSDDYKNLMDNYLLPCLAYYTKYVAMPDIVNSLSNKGVQLLNSEFSQHAQPKECERLEKSAYDKAVVLRDSMMEFINNNLVKFPKYVLLPTKKLTRRGGIVL